MIKLRKSKSRDSRISLQQKKSANINNEKMRNILSNSYLILAPFVFRFYNCINWA